MPNQQNDFPKKPVNHRGKESVEAVEKVTLLLTRKKCKSLRAEKKSYFVK